MSRVARGNFTPRPSRNRTWASRLIRLLSISQNTASLYQKAPPLPCRVDQKVKPIDPTPSLHLHYRDFSTNTGWSAPVLRIGTLTLMGSSHLSFSLNIEATGSHVPRKSLDQVHAIFMPDAAQAVNRFPLDFSWSPISPQFWRHPFLFDTSSMVRLRSSPWSSPGIVFCHAFSYNAHHPGSLPEQLEVVWGLLL
jgi:hypothetical protein